MKVNDDLYILKLPMAFGGDVHELNLSLIVDGDELSLVDTGLPDQEDLLETALAAEGFLLSQVKRILVTHQDLDHIGSLSGLKERTRATIYALAEEIPYINGTLRSVKFPSQERLDANPALKEMIGKLRRTDVDVPLQDDEVLDFAGGVRAIATPGHTLGHTSFYLERTKTLIAGDALTSQNGHLNGPMPIATPDMEAAMSSVRKLADLDVATIVCYHGGIVNHETNTQLQRLSESQPA